MDNDTFDLNYVDDVHDDYHNEDVDRLLLNDDKHQGTYDNPTYDDLDVPSDPQISTVIDDGFL